MKLKYFAYGSNMSLARLSARVPSARRINRCSLPQHSLRLHKPCPSGSGKCDAYYTGNEHDVVHGALFEIDPLEKPALDKVEGLGKDYGEKQVTLISGEGESIEAVTYYALLLEENLKPFDWYLHHVTTGAAESGCPGKYVEELEALISMPDMDQARARREWAIHGLKPPL